MSISMKTNQLHYMSMMSIREGDINHALGLTLTSGLVGASCQDYVHTQKTLVACEHTF